MGTQPHIDQILDGIVTELETIEEADTLASGYVYNLTPEMVVRVPVFSGLTSLLNAATDGPYYFVRDDGPVDPLPEISSFGEQGWTMLVPVVVAHRDRRAERNPLKGATSTGVIQNQMVGDVVACLTSDEKRGTAAIFQTAVQAINRDWHLVEVEEWILAEIFFEVSFVRALGSP